MVNKRETYIDEDGWTQKVPMTDKQCILECLENGRYLAGLDREQVERLIKDYGGIVM